ncbi:glucose-1-phosphate adenylyltransferase subunit GlgD [Clostridium brassicae]|uniref:Glucose-1-phosphate adenylyltransferase subunit GlgD n=1 Tax=Clostridium brassicae TaxID=2999072 RepID=A0ABT4DGD8_9CLOT|nr:glucose-1-phosphate adenylyltransferase subunit GlgD [Clostridium brassicae]MCY6960181.1 glucose-1-phosphate adenylyltransferase subunit GlgD [Clostridium brassicae]
MNNDYMGIISLNENDENIKNLTGKRPLASIPIGGKYRIIDFVLSNMVNGGLTNVGIYTQSRSRSLMDHLDSGRYWDLDRKINGLFIFNFNYSSAITNDIELITNNMEYLYRSKQSKVVFSSSNMICNIDYKSAIDFYENDNNDITIIYKKVKNSSCNFLDCHVLNIGENNSVISVGKNIGTNNEINLSMDMFIMSKDTLLQILDECVSKGYYKSVKEYVYANCDKFNIKAHEFDGYLTCINSTKAYYKANMDMLNPKIGKELFSKNGPIYTKVKDAPPTKYYNGSKASNCLIANGCIIEGEVKNCIISRRVVVHKGAKIENCIIMQNCEIKENAKLTNVIIDKNVVIEKNKELKGDSEFPVVIEKNRNHYNKKAHSIA